MFQTSTFVQDAVVDMGPDLSKLLRGGVGIDV